FKPLHPRLHDENLVDAVFVLGDVTEFMGAHCNYANFGMLASAHDLPKQRISKHDAAIVPAQGRIFGGESIQLHAFRKRKARQYRECFADFEQRHRQCAIESQIPRAAQFTALDGTGRDRIRGLRLRSLYPFGHFGRRERAAVIVALRVGAAGTRKIAQVPASIMRRLIMVASAKRREGVARVASTAGGGRAGGRRVRRRAYGWPLPAIIWCNWEMRLW